MADAILFDEPTRRRLEQLMLVAQKVRAGAIKGERRSTKRGTSIEFADYRNYAPGDDLRRLDWNIYARLGRPLTKLFEDEEDLSVHLLIDTSASMNFPTEGAPDHNKFLWARRLIGGIGYISLTTSDRMISAAVSIDGQRVPPFGPSRGRAASIGWFRWLSELRAAGETDLNATLKDYAARLKRPGLCVIVSDCFSAGGIVDGLNALLGRGCEVALIHTLSPEEVDPPLVGDLRLVDAETSIGQDVSLDPGLREQYIRRVTAWQQDLRADCTRRGAHYIPVVTSAGWDRVILHEMRRAGIVR